MKVRFVIFLCFFLCFGESSATNKLNNDTLKNYLEIYYSTNNNILLNNFSKLKSNVLSNLVTKSFGAQYHRQVKPRIALGCNIGLFERGITITNQKHTYYTNKGLTEHIAYASGTKIDGYLLFSGYFSFTSLNLKKLKISTDLQFGLLTQVYTNQSSKFINYDWIERLNYLALLKIRLDYYLNGRISFSIIPNLATSILSEIGVNRNHTISYKIRPFSYGVGAGLGYHF